MKKTLLFTLALIAFGCADTEQSALCETLPDESSLEDLRTCAKLGNAAAQSRLGYMHETGNGVPEDDVEAVRWYRLAAEGGDAESQYNLGRMYYIGTGVPEDRVVGYMWYNLSAGQGYWLADMEKDIAELDLTREQIAEAQRLSREWIAVHPLGRN